MNQNDDFETHVNYIVYDFQYKMKLPFRYVMFTNLGLFALFFNLLFFDSIALSLGITLMMSYPLFKISIIRSYQIHRLPMHRLGIWLSKMIDKR